MSKKMKPIKVGYISAEQNTLNKMPQYNGFKCGHGPHGDTKYNRRKNKEHLRRILDEG